MKLEKRQPSGREKDQASIKLLEKLREQLHASNPSTARRAAFHLSWMQDDGLDILTEALFSQGPRRNKSAAAYGLRKMRGRMKKKALDAFKQGLKHPNSTTVGVCENALGVLKKKVPKKRSASERAGASRIEIRGVRSKRRQGSRSERVSRPRRNSRR